MRTERFEVSKTFVVMVSLCLVSLNERTNLRKTCFRFEERVPEIIESDDWWRDWSRT